MSDNNILYLGKKSSAGTQVDFVTGDLPQISGFTGHIQDAVLQASVDSITTGKAPSASGVYDFVENVSGILSDRLDNVDTATGALSSATGALSNATGALSAATGNLSAATGNLSAATGALSAATGALSAATGALSAATGALSAATGDLDTRVTALNNVTGDYINTSATSQTKAGGLTLGSFLTVSEDLSVGGNLVVSGTLTTIETETTIIQDPIITLGSGTSAQDGQDRGIDFIYYSDELSSPQTGFFGFDHQKERFVLYTGKSATSEDYDDYPAPFDLSATVDDSTIEYIDGSSFLQVKNLGITNAKLQNSSLTVTAGSGLANGGSVSLGGSTTLDVGAGNGITVGADSISVTGYNGIIVDANGVSVTGYFGIEVTSLGVRAVTNDGLFVDNSGISTFSDQNHLNKIEIGKDNVTTEIINSYGGLVVGRGYSSDGSAVSLTQAGNGDGGGGETLIELPANSTLTAEGVITARDDSQNPSTSASWKFVSTIISDSSSPDTKISHITKIYSDPEASTWTVSITANNDPNGLEIQGAAQGHDHGVAWSCTVNYNILGA
jgi:hypothetical protein